ncbi:hypothetical protein E2C01_002507 [Portunus trituberculatus]|uniref:Uncharacterized protein n=1 Tax=Portunus trituberculatus TaxID=210409 RepID=A0A5B7CKK3_PORTR|nr:hypothetical protein [Portunus trituberculatus]
MDDGMVGGQIQGSEAIATITCHISLLVPTSIVVCCLSDACVSVAQMVFFVFVCVSGVPLVLRQHCNTLNLKSSLACHCRNTDKYKCRSLHTKLCHSELPDCFVKGLEKRGIPSSMSPEYYAKKYNII